MMQPSFKKKESGLKVMFSWKQIRYLYMFRHSLVRLEASLHDNNII